MSAPDAADNAADNAASNAADSAANNAADSATNAADNTASDIANNASNSPPAASRGVPNTRVVGLWRGSEVDAAATLRADQHALLFERETASLMRVPLSALDGWQLSVSQVVLYLRDGDVLDVSLLSDSARVNMRSALDAACIMPELTRSLRAFGRTTGDYEAEHDRWFAPLLTLRRALVGVSDPLRQVALFDADHIGAELTRALAELAAQRTGGDPARSRALEAVFEEETEAVRVSLARAGLAASALEGSAPDSRLADWRRWVDMLRELYERADNAWPAIAASCRAGPG